MEPIILQLPLRSISVIAVQAPTELNTKHIYQLNVILYSFGIDSNIKYSTKHKNSKYSGIYKVLTSLYMFPTLSNIMVMI